LLLAFSKNASIPTQMFTTDLNIHTWNTVNSF